MVSNFGDFPISLGNIFSIYTKKILPNIPKKILAIGQNLPKEKCWFW
jgi:hypothetical protein